MTWIVYVPAGTGELLASSSPPLGSSRAHASPSPHGIPLVWNVGTPFGASNVFVLRNRFINIYIMDKHFMLKNIMFARTHVTQGVDRDLRSSRVVSHANAWASLNALSRLSLRLRIGRHIAIS